MLQNVKMTRRKKRITFIFYIFVLHNRYNNNIYKHNTTIMKYGDTMVRFIKE